MMKLCKFDDMKVRLVMKVRKMTRREALKALGIGMKTPESGETHPEGAASRDMSDKEFWASVQAAVQTSDANEFLNV